MRNVNFACRDEAETIMGMKADRALAPTINRERLTEAIVGALAMLPAIEREVFVAYHYKGLSIARIGQLLMCSAAHVEELLTSARAGFFDFLSDFRRRAFESDP